MLLDAPDRMPFDRLRIFVCFRNEKRLDRYPMMLEEEARALRDGLRPVNVHMTITPRF